MGTATRILLPLNCRPLPLLPVVLLLGALAGCSGTPPGQSAQPGQVDAAKPQGRCAQSQWQAQTAAVINKREGNEALEKYDSEGPEQDAGCH